MNINNVILGGRIVREPDLKSTPSGTDICEMRLAVKDFVKGKEPSTMFIDVVVFSVLAVRCADQLTKGDVVIFEGKLQLDEWQDKDGNKRSKHKMVAFKASWDKKSAQQKPTENDDIPF